MSIFQRMKSLADKMFKQHLFVTNTALATIFMGAGDAIQQSLEKKLIPGHVFDENRSKNMMIIGTGFGLVGHNWYKFLDKVFPGNKHLTVFKKLLAEGASGPPFLLGLFLSVGALEGKPAKKSYEDFKKNIFIICAADWGVYLPMQAINFYFLPPRYRLLYVMCLTLVYDVFLSYIIHKEDNRREQRNDQTIK